MLGTAVKCPACGSERYRELAGLPPPGVDPLMRKYECLDCRTEYWVAPAINYRVRKEKKIDVR